MRRFSLGTDRPYREMSESNLAIIAREFKNRGFIEDEEDVDSDSGMSTSITGTSSHSVVVTSITAAIYRRQIAFTISINVLS